MLRKQFKRLLKALHNCLHLDTLITQNSDILSNTINNTLKQQHHDTVRQRYELMFLQCQESGITEEKYESNELIISLTSYGQRIHNVYLTIESLLQQTLKANKIILWLDKDEFTPKTIPSSLKRQQKRGLEIRFTEDIKSYKKLIPALTEFPDDTIITVDDDCIYPLNLTDILYNQHRTHPRDIICTHAHVIDFDRDGNPKPYIEWADSPKDRSRASFSFFPIGFAGILYPPHCFHPDVLDKDAFMTLAPMADDLWFKIMSLRNHTLCRTVPIYNDILDWITLTNGKYDIWLSHTNVSLFNNSQLKSLMSQYNITQYDFDVFEMTAERIIPELYRESVEQWVLFLKHKYAYEIAQSIIKEGMNVLEIGCGDGYGANMLADSGARITALDIDTPTINFARHKYKKDNLSFDTYNGKDIPFQDHSFDLILSFQVIEHVSDIDSYFHVISQLLKPQGIFLITTPNRSYRLTEGQHPWNPFHITEYNKESIEKLAQKHLPEFRIYSITADQEVLNIEKERCRPMRSDYNDKEFHYIFKRTNFADYYTTNDFRLSTEDIDNGLDILLTNTQL